MDFKQYRYIFVLTYARSGSTLLQSLLNSVDNVQIRGENNNVLYHIFKSIDGVERAKSEHGPSSKAPDTPWYGANVLTPLGFKERMMNVFVSGVLKPSETAEVIGFKEIRHIPHFMNDTDFREYCDFLLDSFPDSRIVFNSRNAEDVSRSAWLKEQNAEDVMRAVRLTDKRFEDYTKSRKRAIHMQYRDYVADPTILDRMFEFLGLEPDQDKIRAVLEKPLTHAKRRPQ